MCMHRWKDPEIYTKYSLRTWQSKMVCQGKPRRNTLPTPKVIQAEFESVLIRWMNLEPLYRVK